MRRDDFTEGTLTLDMKDDFYESHDPMLRRLEGSRRQANPLFDPHASRLPYPYQAVSSILSTTQTKMNQPSNANNRGRTHRSPTVLSVLNAALSSTALFRSVTLANPEIYGFEGV